MPSFDLEGKVAVVTGGGQGIGEGIGALGEGVGDMFGGIGDGIGNMFDGFDGFDV